MDIVTTVLGDIDAARLGFCQPHEHVYIVDTVALATHPELRLSNLPASIAELRLLKKAGGDSVVDAQPLAAGRDALALKTASAQSGINVVACTGYHLPFFYPEGHWIFTAPADRLTDLFLGELRDGMYLGGNHDWPSYRTDIRAGAMKAMLTERGVSGREEILLAAAGQAALAAGVPLLLHTESGKGAVDAVAMLDRLGLPPERVMVCHVDRQTEDLGIHREIAAAGAFLEYDTVTMFHYHHSADEIALIEHMLSRGHRGQILLATDPTRDRLKSYGALVGMDYIAAAFVPLLRACGFSEADVAAMCVENPRRALTKRRA